MGPTTLAARLGLAVVACLATLVSVEVALRIWVSTTEPAELDVTEALPGSTGERPRKDSSGVSLSALIRPSRHADVVYELEPNLAATFKGVRVETNSLGMRDREYTATKPAGTVRIACLGDSVMFGWGVPAADSYPKVVERRLNRIAASGVSYELMNFAVPGYNTAMEVAAFRTKGLDFEPDAVIIHFGRNDLGLPRFMLRPREVWSFDRIWLVEMFMRGTRVLPWGDAELVDSGDLESLPDPDRTQVQDRYRHLAGAEAFSGAVGELAAIAERLTIPVFLLALKTEGPPWDQAERVAVRHGFHVVRVGSSLITYLHERGIHATRENWIETFWLSKDDPHPNAVGHSVYADALYQALLADRETLMRRRNAMNP